LVVEVFLADRDSLVVSSGDKEILSKLPLKFLAHFAEASISNQEFTDSLTFSEDEEGFQFVVIVEADIRVRHTVETASFIELVVILPSALPEARDT
jgi:hypothetical protein